MRYFLLLPALLLAFVAYGQNTGKQITLEDIWKNGTFTMKSVPGFNAMNDGMHYTKIDVDNKHQYIRSYSLKTGERESTLFDGTAQLAGGKELSVEHYTFSKDEQQMLLFTSGEHIYRRSALYDIYIYDRKTGTLTSLNEDKVLHATFSPDGSKVAFVKNNDIFYKDLKSGKTTQITTDGERNRIINGNSDWVYEEEFGFTQAFQWSPDSKSLAYYRFDESEVPEYVMTMYDKLYPTPYTYKYPKAGERNSVIQIKLYNLQGAKTIIADIGNERDIYIPRIKWTEDPAKLCIYRMNRLQNKLELLLANAQNGSSTIIYSEENKYYIEINDNLKFLPDGASFIFNSEQSGYNHLYRWNWKSKKLTALTKGKYDVDDLVGVDMARKKVYYTAAQPTPTQRKLYAVGWDGNNNQCLTTEKGTHIITPCEGYSYFLDKYSRIGKVPVYYLRDNNGKVIRTLEDNQTLTSKMEEYAIGKMRMMEVQGAKQMLNGWMITPPDFDSTKKYPVLMYQYSGPGSQEATDAFPVRVADYYWYQMLAQKGYIIVCADGTGTGFRGQEFKKKTYLQLGKYESDDQIAVAKNLAELPYVDRNRIGIWGWSYGGFMSSTCIMKGNDIFKMAIAVAPVTNWRYYDNIYTERYMRRPQENEKGYDENAPEQMVAGLKGKFLLVHGTGDDNVHVQNSMMMVNEMIKANKEFDSEYYPNRNHGIAGGNTRYHLYKRMTDFVLSNL